MTWQDEMRSKMGARYALLMAGARTSESFTMVKIGMPSLWAADWVKTHWGPDLAWAVKRQYPEAKLEIYYDKIAEADWRREKAKANSVKTKTGMKR